MDYKSARQIALAALAGELGPEEQLAATQASPVSDQQAEQLFTPPASGLSAGLQAAISQGLDTGGGGGNLFERALSVGGKALGTAMLPFEWETQNIGRPATRALLSPLPKGKYKDVLQFIGENTLVPSTFLPVIGFPGLLTRPAKVGAEVGLKIAAERGSQTAGRIMGEIAATRIAEAAKPLSRAAEAYKWLSVGEGVPYKTAKEASEAAEKGIAKHAAAKVRMANFHTQAEEAKVLLGTRLADANAYLAGLEEGAPQILTKGRKRSVWSAYKKGVKIEEKFEIAKKASQEYVFSPKSVRLEKAADALSTAVAAADRFDNIAAGLPDKAGVKAMRVLARLPIWSAEALKTTMEKSGDPMKLGWALRQPGVIGNFTRFVLGHAIYHTNPGVMGSIYSMGNAAEIAQEVTRMRAKTWMKAQKMVWKSAGLDKVGVEAYRGPGAVVKAAEPVAPEAVAKSVKQTASKVKVATKKLPEVAKAAVPTLSPEKIGENLTRHIWEHPEWFNLTPVQQQVIDALHVSLTENLAYTERLMGVDTPQLLSAIEKQGVGAGMDMAVHVGEKLEGGRYLPLYLDPKQFADKGYRLKGTSDRIGAVPRFLKERKVWRDTAHAAVENPGLKFMSKDDALAARWEASVKATSDSVFREGALKHLNPVTKPGWGLTPSEAIPGYYFETETARQITKMADLITGKTPMQGTRQAFNIVRSMKLAWDLSGGIGIQGFFFLSSSMTNPGLMLRTIYSGTKFAFSPQAYDEWLMTKAEHVLKFQSLGLRVSTNAVDLQRITKGELFPRIYRIPGKMADMLNDANFGRLVSMYKIEAAEQWLDTMKYVRDVPGFSVIAKTSPSISSMLDKIKGVEGRSMDDIGRAVMHEINNRFGGISMAMTGKSTERAFVEQLADIAPSWFRARTSLVMDALKGEGPARYMALNLMGREMFLAGKLSTGMSHLFTGEAPEFDPRKGNFLAIKIPGGGTIPMLPSVSLLRFATRFGASVVQSIPGLPGSDPSAGGKGAFNALQRFVASRESPMVGLAIEQATGKDFLGRDVSSNEDRFLGAIKSVLPIFGEDVWETWEAGGSPRTILQHGVVSALGSSVYPARPYDLYKDALMSWASERGKVLPQENPDAPASQQITQVDEKEFRLGPGKELWEKFLSNREQWGEDARDHLYGVMDTFNAQWENGTDNKPGAKALARAVNAGEIPAFKFREVMKDYWTQNEAIFDTTQRNLGLTDAELESDPKRVSKLDRVANEYFKIQLDDFDADKDGELGDNEYAAYSAARESCLAAWQEKIPDVDLAAFVKTRRLARFDDPDIRTAMESLLDTQETLDTFYTIPRWKGLTVEQGARVDALRALGGKAADQLRRYAADAGRPELIKEITEKHGWRYIMANIPAEVPPEDYPLLKFAAAVETNEKVWDAFSNDDRMYFLAKNTDILRWYPTLINLFPDDIRAILPPDIEYNLDEWLADYEEEYGVGAGTPTPGPGTIVPEALQ